MIYHRLSSADDHQHLFSVRRIFPTKYMEHPTNYTIISLAIFSNSQFPLLFMSDCDLFISCFVFDTLLHDCIVVRLSSELRVKAESGVRRYLGFGCP